MLVRAVAQAMLLFVPWAVRRRALNRLFGYRIHPTATIGLSIVAPYVTLEMGPGARIGHLNLMRGMDTITLGRAATIAHLNWVYGIPGHYSHLQHEAGRRSELVLEHGAGVTRRHLIDCSNTVRIESMALVAGYGTQILTHAIDLTQSQQGTKPVTIGRAAMVGTRSVILGGAKLPPFSALGAGSTLRNAYEDPYTVYSGVPARPAGKLPEDAAFFTRADGYVGA